MSWQQYIDVSLVGTGRVDKAAIVGLEDQSCWATSPGFQVSSNEIKEIVNGLKQTNLDKLRADGFYVAGERYVLTRSEERSLIGRKGQEGVVISRSKMAVLIAHYNKDMIAGNCSSTVEGLADYLEKQGY